MKKQRIKKMVRENDTELLEERLSRLVRTMKDTTNAYERRSHKIMAHIHKTTRELDNYDFEKKIERVEKTYFQKMQELFLDYVARIYGRRGA